MTSDSKECVDKLDIARNVEIARQRIKGLSLRLDGFTVLTECASNAYALTPVMAAMAGARVLAVGSDSSYGTFVDNRKFIQELFDQSLTNGSSSSNGCIEFFQDTLPDDLWNAADIVTNSGQLRPFTCEKIDKLNSHAVLCLMWETWEVRDDEIDFVAFQRTGIPVIGTNENFPAADMYGYPGVLCLKMLFEMGMEVANNHFVLLGEGLTGRLVADSFRSLGVSFDWFVADQTAYQRYGECFGYSELARILELPRLDALICVDHVTRKPVISEGEAVTLEDLCNRFPYAKWAHLTGAVDVEQLEKSEIDYYPRSIKPHGFMSYETMELGWEPVIVLNAAGLKVGEIAASARRSGATAKDAIQATVDYGIGQDFEGGFFDREFE